MQKPSSLTIKYLKYLSHKLSFLIVPTLLVVFLTQIASAKPDRYPIDIPPDASSPAYQTYLERTSTDNHIQKSVPDWLTDWFSTDYTEKMIEAGTRNLAWLNYMNENRPEKIQLTKPGELKSYPITSPSIYNAEIVQARYKSLLKETPKAITDIVFGGAEFTKDPPLDLDDYVQWAYQIDRAYQTASRWKLMKPNLFWYAQNASNDLRGFYFLTHDPQVESKLNNWGSNTQEEQIQLKEWLVQMCTNSNNNKSSCKKSLESSISNSNVFSFFNLYLSNSQKLWNSYFELSTTHRDIKWSSETPDVTVVPFRSTLPHVEEYLKYNIEDEWKWDNWQLLLDFQPYAKIHVEFEPGATPHVNGLGGSTITMDANAPLTEWDVQWTIRHEFGHVVGFTDCYIEFYDNENKQMINYQLDIKDFMCSRAGKFQQAHFDEMKRVYYK